MASASQNTVNWSQKKPEGMHTIGHGDIVLGNSSFHTNEMVFQGVASRDSKKQRDFRNRKKCLKSGFFPASFHFSCLSSNISKYLRAGPCAGAKDRLPGGSVSWTPGPHSLMRGDGDIRGNYSNPAWPMGAGWALQGMMATQKMVADAPRGLEGQGRELIWSWVSQERCYGVNCVPREFI